MATWRVWNMHPDKNSVHREKFRDDMIEIKAGKYVLMDYEDAVQFKGQYFPMIIGPDGQHDPKGFKMIKLEKHDPSEEQEVQTEFISPIDGKKFHSQAELDKYLKTNFSDQVFKDEVLDQEIEKKKRK